MHEDPESAKRLTQRRRILEMSTCLYPRHLRLLHTLVQSNQCLPHFGGAQKAT